MKGDILHERKRKTKIEDIDDLEKDSHEQCYIFVIHSKSLHFLQILDHKMSLFNRGCVAYQEQAIDKLARDRHVQSEKAIAKVTRKIIEEITNRCRKREISQPE